MRWLWLDLCAPLSSFGGATIDARGVTRDFPSTSAVTGLLGNALGYERRDTAALDRLQARLVFAARREAEPPLGRLTDFQTAQLGKDDKGWTTYGGPEGRDGGADTYKSPHIRLRDYHADCRMRVVLRLDPVDEAPDLDALARALDHPARPLFLGRKSCLPARRLFGGWLEAHGPRAALIALPAAEPATARRLRALWPVAAGGTETEADAVREITDARNWRSGLHGGTRRVAEGRITPAPPP